MKDAARTMRIYSSVKRVTHAVVSRLIVSTLVPTTETLLHVSKENLSHQLCASIVVSKEA